MLMRIRILKFEIIQIPLSNYRKINKRALAKHLNVHLKVE